MKIQLEQDRPSDQQSRQITGAARRKAWRRREECLKRLVIIVCTLWLLTLVALVVLWHHRQESQPLATATTPVIIADKLIATQMLAAPESTEPAPVYPLTEKERDLIAAVVWGEARGEGIAGMAAVAEVVLNRLMDGRFGETLMDICTPDQFHGLRHAGEQTISEDAYYAVDQVFSAGRIGSANGALFFCVGDPDAIKSGLVQVAKIGRHTFYVD